MLGIKIQVRITLWNVQNLKVGVIVNQSLSGSSQCAVAVKNAICQEY